jgi:lipopolysaccharide transport system ATP-binding protein
MAAVISAEHVSKTYRLGTIGGATLQEDVARWWAKVRRRTDPLLKVGEVRRQIGEQFWALRDLSFEVPEGQILGVIGPNGAGKSTLLKILSQVTAPSSGRIRVWGRVASLLEIGTGFHPDLTGRENVFLNGAILGMTKAEIRSKFDEIVAFSECEAFIDTPVRRYSSGMCVRLAFAVAAHLEPEILIIDEVLAVGDAQFQKKCLGKMGEVSRGGRTVLFVSHNMIAVQSLCDRAILLRDGRLASEGSVTSVVSEYFHDVRGHQVKTCWPTADVAPGNETLRIKEVRITPAEARPDGVIGMNSPVRVDTDFWVLQRGLQLHLTYHLLNEQGITVLTTGSPAERRPNGLYRASFTIPGHLLNSGGYSLKLLIVQSENRVTYEREAIASFSVVDTAERRQACMGREPGIVQPIMHWKLVDLEERSAVRGADERVSVA